MDNYREDFIARIKKIPISIPLFTTLISLYGFILLYSAAGGHIEPWAYKQILVFLIFMPVSILIAIIDLKVIYHFAYVFYIITLLLLLFVELMGKSAMGATRWLDLGLFTIQPSELVKISVVMMLAKFFHEYSNYTVSDFILILPLIASIIPIYLVIRQPDLGTGMITLIVVCFMFFAAGVKRIYFIISSIIGLTAMPAMWFMLYDYQRNRILTFINPEADPLGKGYNIIQSKIAIGSGGFLGKGLLSGTQGPLSFLPEYETDFIFSFLTEELGFIGVLFVLGFFFLLFTLLHQY